MRMQRSVIGCCVLINCLDLFAESRCKDGREENVADVASSLPDSSAFSNERIRRLSNFLRAESQGDHQVSADRVTTNTSFFELFERSDSIVVDGFLDKAYESMSPSTEQLSSKVSLATATAVDKSLELEEAATAVTATAAAMAVATVAAATAELEAATAATALKAATAEVEETAARAAAAAAEESDDEAASSRESIAAMDRVGDTVTSSQTHGALLEASVQQLVDKLEASSLGGSGSASGTEAGEGQSVGFSSNKDAGGFDIGGSSSGGGVVSGAILDGTLGKGLTSASIMNDLKNLTMALASLRISLNRTGERVRRNDCNPMRNCKSFR
jgi:hypothetical protein